MRSRSRSSTTSTVDIKPIVDGVLELVASNRRIFSEVQLVAGERQAICGSWCQDVHYFHFNTCPLVFLSETGPCLQFAAEHVIFIQTAM